MGTSVIIKTKRFGQLTIGEDEIIEVPQGILGFPEYRHYCLIDPGDDTLIVWLQSVEDPEVAFALLEPKLFKPDYVVHLSGAELRELQLKNVNQAAVFSILTIPDDIVQMTANLKAPIVINLKDQIAKQVILQENEYAIKSPMFKELRAMLAAVPVTKCDADGVKTKKRSISAIPVRNIPPTMTIKS
jgi:flagellar assembly factor FliW